MFFFLLFFFLVMYSSQELMPYEMLNLGENSKPNERVEKLKEVWYFVSKALCELREQGQNEGMKKSHSQAVRSFVKWGGGKSD